MEVHNPLYLKYAKKYTDNTPTKKGALHLRYFTTELKRLYLYGKMSTVRV